MLRLAGRSFFIKPKLKVFRPFEAVGKKVKPDAMNRLTEFRLMILGIGSLLHHHLSLHFSMPQPAKV